MTLDVLIDITESIQCLLVLKIKPLTTEICDTTVCIFVFSLSNAELILVKIASICITKAFASISDNNVYKFHYHAIMVTFVEVNHYFGIVFGQINDSLAIFCSVRSHSSLQIQ